MTSAQFVELLRGRIHALDVDSVRKEVSRFVREHDQLKIWSRNYFLQLSDLVKL